MNIHDLIPFGKENAISRKTLVSLACYNGLIDRKKDVDRSTRKLISESRFSGHPILYVPTTGGYYRPTENEIAELRDYIKTEEHRAIKTIASLNSAKGILHDLETGAIEKVVRE